jgi:cyclase
MSAEQTVPTWEPGVKQLAPNVYAYLAAKATWYWSNAGFIVGRDYVVVVDSLSTVGLTEKFKDEIKKVTDKPVRYLINTHHHGDHTWGNHLFAGASIISHGNCRHEAIATGVIDPGLLNTIFPEFDFRGIAVTPADITFDRQLTLNMDDREIKLLYFGPGHTIGDVIVYLPEERLIFTGDLIFLYSTPLAMEGSVSGWISDLDAITKLEANTYVPGHGPVCDIKGLNLCRDYLALVRNEAKNRFDKGMSAVEAAKDIDLGNFKMWPNRERILANVERLWREFRGEDPATSKLDIGDVFFRMATMAQTGEL